MYASKSTVIAAILSVAVCCVTTFADEASVDPTELVRQAEAAGKQVHQWHYHSNPGFGRIAKSSTWNKTNKDAKAGDLFRVVDPPTPPPHSTPAFRVTQIISANQFIDLDHQFLVEGLDTSALSDGQLIQQQFRLSEYVGVVVGPFQYGTAGGGKKTVTHIKLGPDPLFVVSEKEKTEGFRLWTSAKNQKVVAKLKTSRGSTIVLETRDGKSVRLKLSEFSDADQAFLKSQ